MEVPKGFFSYLRNLLAFLPFFGLLLVLGIIKAAVIGPVVFLVITVGNSGVIVGLWPCHVIWTYYCIATTKKFGVMLKVLLSISALLPFLVWLITTIIGSTVTGFVYGFFRPLIATFEAVLEGVPNKFIRCFKTDVSRYMVFLSSIDSDLPDKFFDGTWDTILGGCTIVRDFTDVCFHSYFSVMDGLLESKGEAPIEIKLSQIPGCALAAALGVSIDVPMITVLVIYKAPIMLFKGWQRLFHDLIGREGPFLETVCVPVAGLLILLWPIAVSLAVVAGCSSSFVLGCYAFAVAYQENSTKRGLLYIISAIAMFDEYTNDLLSLREGSCFPRPQYRSKATTPSPLPIKRTISSVTKRPPTRTPSMKRIQELNAYVVWQNFFSACESHGKELLEAGAIKKSDLEEWQNSKNKILTIGLPAYAFLYCLLRSIKSGSTGFLMGMEGDNTELTSVNRPEGKVFDWLFEPMSILKEQIKAIKLHPEEEAYLLKLTLYCCDTHRMEAWENGGIPPHNEIRRAQLEGIICASLNEQYPLIFPDVDTVNRLQGFALTVSRLPSFRRLFEMVVKVLLEEAQKRTEESSKRNAMK
ncbi:hypothetical protein ACLOJK_002987 [Asimina triloba]